MVEFDQACQYLPRPFWKSANGHRETKMLWNLEERPSGGKDRTAARTESLLDMLAGDAMALPFDTDRGVSLPADSSKSDSMIICFSLDCSSWTWRVFATILHKGAQINRLHDCFNNKEEFRRNSYVLNDPVIKPQNINMDRVHAPFLISCSENCKSCACTSSDVPYISAASCQMRSRMGMRWCVCRLRGFMRCPRYDTTDGIIQPVGFRGVSPNLLSRDHILIHIFAQQGLSYSGQQGIVDCSDTPLLLEEA